jgi:hypothetical protein
MLASAHYGRYHLRLITGVTQFLHALEQGDPRAASRLLPLGFDELRVLLPGCVCRRFCDRALSSVDLRVCG